MLFDKFRKKDTEDQQNTTCQNTSKAAGTNQTVMHIEVSVATDPGCVREANEDNFFVSKIGGKQRATYCRNAVLHGSLLKFFAVFDGMGGEAYGEEASAIASETLADFAAGSKDGDITEESIKAAVEQFISLANQGIVDMISERKCGRSGCTMALAAVYQNTVYPFSIGDSRIYRISQDTIEQISEDQTVAVKKLKANIYTEEEARESPDAHRITSYIGLDDRGVGVSYHAYKPFPLSGCRVLLCSDGLTDMCTDAEIFEILSGASGKPAFELAKAALLNGGEDNVTCIVIGEQA